MAPSLRVLAVDTSTASGSVAVVEDGRLVAEVCERDVGGHAAWLLPAVKSTIEGAGMGPADIDLFALGLGPGSFTGLRIGVSTVKGLAWTLGRPVMGVSSLEALAMNLAGSGRGVFVCPLFDARKKEVYRGVYRPAGGRMERVIDDGAARPEALADELAALDGEVVLLGDGLVLYGDMLARKVPRCRRASEDLWLVRGSAVAALALAALADGLRPSDPADIRPRYKRRSEAELKADGGKGR